MHVWDVPEPFAGPVLMARWRELGRHWGSGSPVALPLRAGPDGHGAFVMGAVLTHSPPTRCGSRSTCSACPAGWIVRPSGPARRRTDPAAIGRRLLIAERTVHKHLERVYAELGVRDRLGAVFHAQRLGLLPSP